MSDTAESVMRHYLAEFTAALDRYYAAPDVSLLSKRKLWMDAAIAVAEKEPNRP